MSANRVSTHRATPDLVAARSRGGGRGAAERAVAIGRGTALTLGVALSTTVTAWLIGRGVMNVAGNQQAPWILGRAAGFTSYLLLVGLVGFGLVLSHPWRSRVTWPSTAARIRIHVSLAVFTLAFLVLHVVVLATDSYAGVGLRGALLPMGASYRPVPVTLGVIGAYAGLLAGLTAAMAGRVTARIWWPIHKVAAVSLVLVWVHGLLSGSDSPALLAIYLGTGFGLVVLAISRYAARTPADRVAELTAGAGR